MRIGVVGTGALGRHHVRILAEDPAAELVGIFDTDRTVAERVGIEFGAEVFDDLDSLAEGLEAAVVAVPAWAYRRRDTWRLEGAAVRGASSCGVVRSSAPW